MHILVTNDDGVHAPGLAALADAMRPLGRVTILAPDHNWSGGGHVKTLHRPLRVLETTLRDGTPALMSDGAPSDCVALAMLGRVAEKIDLVVSGINPHGNLGHDVTYSGTVTAAMEAVIAGVPGFAFSLAADDTTSDRDYATAAGYAGRVVAAAVAQGLTRDLLLNVNVPCRPAAQIKGIRVTRLGLDAGHRGGAGQSLRLDGRLGGLGLCCRLLEGAFLRAGLDSGRCRTGDRRRRYSRRGRLTIGY